MDEGEAEYGSLFLLPRTGADAASPLEDVLVPARYAGRPRPKPIACMGEMAASAALVRGAVWLGHSGQPADPH
jgi:hypothetical protein